MNPGNTPRTIKVVIIGDSGAGKVSHRLQYITGRFSSAYRATIGADFITKKVPHHANPEEFVMLQIWDTAGQERFSSLSTAFFRGADAAILVFDVTNRNSLNSLKKWWEEFATKCPVPRENEVEFCVTFVGNKIDLSAEHGPYNAENGSHDTGMNGNGNGTHVSQSTHGRGPVVTEQLAQQFLRELIPLPKPATPTPERPARRRTITIDGVSLDSDDSLDRPTTRPADIPHANGHPRMVSSDTEPEPESPPRSVSRARSIGAPSGSPRPPWISRIKSRALSREGNGTATTGYSIYHTPATSLFRTTSPVRGRASPNQSQLRRGGSSVMSMETARSHFSASTPVQSRSRLVSYSSVGTTESDATVKPNKVSDGTALPDLEETSTNPPDPALENTPLETGPQLFWASACTGQGVSSIFEYIARRVVKRWEWEESRLGFDEAGDEDEGPTALRLRDDWGKGKKSWKAACC
ncbi:Ras-related protein Rab-7A [Ceratobasidium sp. AG-Ba]|nr:Ras-related protein Rab-7A [Ceratobasidium sp. AG-Ba]